MSAERDTCAWCSLALSWRCYLDVRGMVFVPCCDEHIANAYDLVEVARWLSMQLATFCEERGAVGAIDLARSNVEPWIDAREGSQ